MNTKITNLSPLPSVEETKPIVQLTAGEEREIWQKTKNPNITAEQIAALSKALVDKNEREKLTGNVDEIKKLVDKLFPEIKMEMNELEKKLPEIEPLKQKTSIDLEKNKNELTHLTEELNEKLAEKKDKDKDLNIIYDKINDNLLKKEALLSIQENLAVPSDKLPEIEPLKQKTSVDLENNRNELTQLNKELIEKLTEKEDKEEELNKIYEKIDYNRLEKEALLSTQENLPLTSLKLTKELKENINLREDLVNSVEKLLETFAKKEKVSSSKVVNIDLENHQLTPDEVKTLAESLRKEDGAIKMLNLKNCGLNDQDVKTIMEALTSRRRESIEIIDFSENKIGDEGAKVIAIALGSKSIDALNELRLDNVNISDKGVLRLAQAVLNNTASIDTINLRGKNRVTINGAREFAEKLNSEQQIFKQTTHFNLNVTAHEAKEDKKLAQLNESIKKGSITITPAYKSSEEVLKSANQSTLTTSETPGKIGSSAVEQLKKIDLEIKKIEIEYSIDLMKEKFPVFEAPPKNAPQKFFQQYFYHASINEYLEKIKTLLTEQKFSNMEDWKYLNQQLNAALDQNAASTSQILINCYNNFTSKINQETTPSAKKEGTTKKIKNAAKTVAKAMPRVPEKKTKEVKAETREESTSEDNKVTFFKQKEELNIHLSAIEEKFPEHEDIKKNLKKIKEYKDQLEIRLTTEVTESANKETNKRAIPELRYMDSVLKSALRERNSSIMVNDALEAYCKTIPSPQFQDAKIQDEKSRFSAKMIKPIVGTASAVVSTLSGATKAVRKWSAKINPLRLQNNKEYNDPPPEDLPPPPPEDLSTTSNNLAKVESKQVQLNLADTTKSKNPKPLPNPKKYQKELAERRQLNHDSSNSSSAILQQLSSMDSSQVQPNLTDIYKEELYDSIERLNQPAKEIGEDDDIDVDWELKKFDEPEAVVGKEDVSLDDPADGWRKEYEERQKAGATEENEELSSQEKDKDDDEWSNNINEKIDIEENIKNLENAAQGLNDESPEQQKEEPKSANLKDSHSSFHYSPYGFFSSLSSESTVKNNDLIDQNSETNTSSNSLNKRSN